MTINCCRTCGQALQADVIQAQLERIKIWCLEQGISPAFGDSLTKEQTARYLGRSPRTVGNWLPLGVGPDSRTVRGRRYYRLIDIAEFIASESRSDPS